MAGRRRKLTITALVFALLAAGIFLPPRINGSRFRNTLRTALSSALGREVRIREVKFRLLPRPGFDLYGVQVMDDPAFGAEPLLSCGEVTANLRLTSLWLGRLEIASLALENNADSTPSLNLVYAGGHWNMESILLRAGQVPSAPTARRTAEHRPRFPYIEASGGRINVKVGAEKKPFALTNTDFAFWLQSEDQWHVRLEGFPVRTDMNLLDIGSIRLEGDLRRARDLRELPVRIQAQWKNAQMGQLSSLLFGQDNGWRGRLDLNAELTGSLSGLHLAADADLRNLRRYDIKRDDMPRLAAHCEGQYAQAALSWNCAAPAENGAVQWTGGNSQTATGYDCALALRHIPLELLTTFARESQHLLPEDLSATGELNGEFGCHFEKGHPVEWHGSGSASEFVLSSSSSTKPFLVSAIQFHAGNQAAPAPPKSSKKVRSQPKAITPPGSFTFDPFSVQMATDSALRAEGLADASGYHLQVKGASSLERLLELGRTIGMSSRITNTTGSATVDMAVNGAWASFEPPRLSGMGHLQNVKALASGLKQPLLLSAADVQFTDTALILSHISGRFGNSDIAFTGSTSHGWMCPGEASCPFQFDLLLESASISEAAGILGSAQSSGWQLPFFSGTSQHLPEFRANGTLRIGSLKLGGLQAEKFTALVDVSNHALAFSHIAANIAGGTVVGGWSADWSTLPVRYSSTGVLSGVPVERLAISPAAASLLASWITGKSNISYSLQLEGNNAEQLVSGAKGRIQFTVLNGTSRAFSLETGKAMKFRTFQGVVEADHGVLTVLPGKIQAENRIYEISGTITLADRQTKLKIGNKGAEWDVTGALEKPHVATHAVAVSAGVDHSQ
ncbi:MAG TPA: AsmA family protein [Candidatus Angelobacter sp.]|nr:AsmA family protein [Candidatus Angelobacter sp.]